MLWDAGAGTSAPSGVPLLVLAFPSGWCVLVRLCRLGSYVPLALEELLADESIVKFGPQVFAQDQRLQGRCLPSFQDLNHLKELLL